MNDTRKNPKACLMWGYYNFGRLLGVKHNRKFAVLAVEKHTGRPWSEAKAYMEIHKVRVETYRP